MLAALPGDTALLAPALAKAAGVGAGVVQAMARDGLLATVPLVDRPSWPRPDPDRQGVELTPAQRSAADDLVPAGRGRRRQVALLDGVPGAGKTEVYFEAVAAALRAGRRVLVLLPEIALSAQWLGALRAPLRRPPRPSGTRP